MDIRDLKHLFDENVFEKIYNRFTNLTRFVKLEFDFSLKDENTIIIHVKQFDKLTDEIYTHKEINDFVRSFVDIIEETGKVVHINVGKFETDPMGLISASWVKEKMLEYEISQRTLAKDLGVDEFIISKLLSNKVGFTRWHKAAFMYYFKSINAPEKVKLLSSGEKSIKEITIAQIAMEESLKKINEAINNTTNKQVNQ